MVCATKLGRGRGGDLKISTGAACFEWSGNTFVVGIVVLSDLGAYFPRNDAVTYCIRATSPTYPQALGISSTWLPAIRSVRDMQQGHHHLPLLMTKIGRRMCLTASRPTSKENAAAGMALACTTPWALDEDGSINEGISTRRCSETGAIQSSRRHGPAVAATTLCTSCVGR